MKEIGIDIDTILVSHVSALVSSTADLIQRAWPSANILEVESRLYRLLEQNCGDKSKIGKALADEGRKLFASKQSPRKKKK